MTLHPQAGRRAGAVGRGAAASERPGLRRRQHRRRAGAAALRRGRAEGRSRSTGSRTSTPTACAAGSTSRRAPGRTSCILHGGGFVFNDVDVHDAAPAGWPTAPAWRCSASTTGGRPSTGSRRRPTTSTRCWPGWPRGAGARPDRPDVVHGDSAGGNLALVAALRHPGASRAVVLIYPFLDPTRRLRRPTPAPPTASTRARRAWYWQQYAATPADLRDPDLAPLRSDRLRHAAADAGRHAPSTTRCATRASELAAGSPRPASRSSATRYLGQVHGFWRHPALFDAAEPLMRQVAGSSDRRTPDERSARIRAMRVHLGSDHAGLELKDHLLGWLADHGHEPVDHGPFVYDAARRLPGLLPAGRRGRRRGPDDGLDSLGVVIGGSGNGEQIAANKVRRRPRGAGLVRGDRGPGPRAQRRQRGLRRRPDALASRT